MDFVRAIENEQLRDDLVDFAVGDRVRVFTKVFEGEKERTQPFDGTVIAIKHGGASKTFTVRRVSRGEGVERTFPLNSPIIDRIDMLTRGSVRRSKLYYLRGRSGRGSRIREARQRTSDTQ